MFGWLWVSLVGCTGTDVGPGGTNVWDLFPFDGERTWEYISTDVDLAYKVIATSTGEPDRIGDNNVYTVEYAAECVGADPACVDGEVLWRIQWSSDIVDGVFHHGYDAGAGLVSLDPPVHIALDTMLRDDVLETSTGGTTWSSTLQGFGACPIAMAASWDECGIFEIASGGDDGYPLAGEWWATKGNGIAAFTLTSQTGQWQLSDLSCEGACDGVW